MKHQITLLASDGHGFVLPFFCSQEKFSSCFTTIREKNPVEFRSITEQLMQHLQNNIEVT